MFIIKEGTPADKVGEGTTKETIESINKFLETQGMTIRTADQDNSYTQKKIDEAFGQRNRQLEQTIKEVTGIDPLNRDEKYFDYFKRAMAEKLKTASGGSAEEVTTLKAKIADLEKNGGSAQAIQQYKEQLDTAQRAHATVRTELEGKITQLQKDIFMGRVNGDVQGYLSELRPKLKKTDFLEDVIQSRLNKFSSENIPHDFEGHVIFKDADGKTRSSTKDGKPKAAREIMDELFADLIDKDRKAGGAGSGGTGKLDDKGKTDITIDKGTIKNRQMLYKHLKEDLKLDESSKEFAAAFEQNSVDLPLR